MDVIIDRCCGLDVHKETVVACLLVTNGKRVRKEVRTFRTFTSELTELAEWLVSEGCTHVGMESTGVYWMPVYAVLEETELELIVGNARHIRNVPGRKTDVKDAEWIARLIRNGLIRPSFVPCKEQRELRDFVRFRKSLVQQRTSERNRLLKLLEQANIKLRSVVSDVFGKSGLAMLEALVENKKTPEAIVALARGRLKQKRADLLLALDGRVKPHHRQLLRLQLDRLSQLQDDIEAVELEIKARVEKHAEIMDRLQTTPGIGKTVAAIVLAEIGTDVEAFSSDHGLAAWAGLCPGNNQSAGKTIGRRQRKGNVHLKSALTEAAHAAVRVRGTYFREKFQRLKSRRGYQRALLAIAHKILRSIYFILHDRTDFKDLGEAYLDQLARRRIKGSLVRRLESLGFDVELRERTLLETGS